MAGVDRDETELGGLVQALTDQVDGVHLAGSAQLRAVGGQQADRARAEHGDGIGRPDAGQLGGVPSCYPRVSDEDEIVFMLVTRDAGQHDAVRIRERNPYQFRLRTAERAHARHRVRAADMPRMHPQARGAIAARTVEAHTAVDMRGQHNTVTALHAMHRPADVLDYSQPFVTEHHAGRRPGTAVIHVQVRAAQRAGGDPDHHIVIPLDPGVRHILHRHLPGRLEHNSPHAKPPHTCQVPGRRARRASPSRPAWPASHPCPTAGQARTGRRPSAVTGPRRPCLAHRGLVTVDLAGHPRAQGRPTTQPAQREGGHEQRL